MRHWINLIETNQERELSEDDVWEMIHDFAATLETHMQSSDAVTFNEVQPTDTQNYPQLMLAGYPEDGFSLEVAQATIEPLNAALEKGQWHLAKKFVAQNRESHEEYLRDDPDYDYSPQLLIFFGWLPNHGETTTDIDELFHVCREENVDSILRDGLRPSIGGSDFISTHQARIYCATSYDGALGVASDINKHRGWDDLVLLRIDDHEITDRTWHVDMELPHASVWTDQAIPASSISHYGKLISHS